MNHYFIHAGVGSSSCLSEENETKEVVVAQHRTGNHCPGLPSRREGGRILPLSQHESRWGNDFCNQEAARQPKTL